MAATVDSLTLDVWPRVPSLSALSSAYPINITVRLWFDYSLIEEETRVVSSLSQHSDVHL